MKIIIIFTLLFCLVVNTSCSNNHRIQKNSQQKEESDMETKYQQEWETALENQNFEIINKLIAQKRRFKLSFYGDDYNIKTDTISNPLLSLFYWSINKNSIIANRISNMQILVSSKQSNILFLKGLEDTMYIDQLYSVSHREILKNRKNNQQVSSILSDYQKDLDTLQLEIKQCRDQGKANLKLIEFALDRGCKLAYETSSKLIYDAEYSVNEVSFIYYFDKIALNSDYFELRENDFQDISKILAEFLPSMSISPSIIRYLYNKGINKKEFFDRVYPVLGDDEELGMDSCLPTYENEKILFDLMPDDMQKHSGHTLLHSAILNVCVDDVENLIRKNKKSLYIKTDPKYFFLYIPERKSFSPLELARLKRKEIDDNLRKYSPNDNAYFTNSLLSKQINKIVIILENETGQTSNEKEWSTLVE